MAPAITGFPLITVPAGYAYEVLPLGLTFMGRPWSEATLLRLAYAFEQAHPVRRPPSYRPTCSTCRNEPVTATRCHRP